MSLMRLFRFGLAFSFLVSGCSQDMSGFTEDSQSKEASSENGESLASENRSEEQPDTGSTAELQNAEQKTVTTKDKHLLFEAISENSEAFKKFVRDRGFDGSGAHACILNQKPFAHIQNWDLAIEVNNNLYFFGQPLDEKYNRKTKVHRWKYQSDSLSVKIKRKTLKSGQYANLDKYWVTINDEPTRIYECSAGD